MKGRLDNIAVWGSELTEQQVQSCTKYILHDAANNNGKEFTKFASNYLSFIFYIFDTMRFGSACRKI